MIKQNGYNEHIFHYNSYVYSIVCESVQSSPVPFPNGYDNIYFSDKLNNNIKHHKLRFNDVYKKIKD